ncbi:MAG: LemA family protein [Granulosicoccaceae bacterium]
MNTFQRALIGAALLASVTGCGINNIPTYDESVTAAWSNVENQFQRRADLIPNLVETVKGYAAHEEEVLVEVIEARNKATQMQIPADLLSNPEAFSAFQANQGEITQALSKLFALSEAYPDLKANQNFLELQAQLEGTENRIAVARRDYITAVQQYNTELRTIPGRWWHSLMYSDMQKRETFSAESGAEENPQVKFN